MAGQGPLSGAAKSFNLWATVTPQPIAHVESEVEALSVVGVLDGTGVTYIASVTVQCCLAAFSGR